jgi:hypothetical protein
VLIFYITSPLFSPPQVVFQIFAAEDSLTLPSGGGCADLWTSDPWTLVSQLRPGSMPLMGEVRRRGWTG